MGCLNENTMAELIGGRLADAARRGVLAHLDACADCRELVAMAARGGALTQPDMLPDETVTRVRSRARTGAPMLALGEHVDHFRIVRLLGRGGMGEVYVARDTKLARKVALKVIHAELFGDEDARARFQREARAMARVNHPNIVTIHAVGEHRNMPYVAMEYVEGQSLAETLAQRRLPLDEAIRIAAAIAEALAEAHKRGVVHRDLKPENVILGDDGRVRVVDFGLARLGDFEDAETVVDAETVLASLETGLAGTPHYMSPEQWESSGTNAATDVWALGVILFEMVTGQRPFDARSLVELGRAVMSFETPPTHPSMAPKVSDLVARCLSRESARRPAASEVVAQLRRLAHDAPRRRRRWPWLVLGAALLVSMAIGATRLMMRETRVQEAPSLPTETVAPPIATLQPAPPASSPPAAVPAPPPPKRAPVRVTAPRASARPLDPDTVPAEPPPSAGF